MPINPGILKGADQIISQIDNLPTEVLPFFVLIAGGSCSGKTTLADELKKRLFSASILRMDDYFRDINDPDLPIENGRKSFNNPGSYQLEEITEHLKTLNQRLSVLAPIYDLEHNQRTREKKLIPTADIIIVDGLYAIDLARGLKINHLSVFVSAPYQTRLYRRIERDKNIVSAEVIEYHFRCHVEPLYKKYVFPQLNEAKIIIKNE